MIRMLRIVSNVRFRSLRSLVDLTKETVSSKLNTAAIVIDVRNFSEVDHGTIDAKNWIHIPLGEVGDALALDSQDFEEQFEKPKPEVNAELIIYCMKGRRSHMAGVQFENHGYSNVANYVGGWWDWNNDWNKTQWIGTVDQISLLAP